MPVCVDCREQFISLGPLLQRRCGKENHLWVLSDIPTIPSEIAAITIGFPHLE
jgi:hypothetical protein